MKKQIAVTLLILATVAMYAFARPSDTGGSSNSGKGTSLQGAYKDMIQLVPFTFSSDKVSSAKPVS